MQLDVEAAARIAYGGVRALAIEAGQAHVPLSWDKAPEWARNEMRTEIVEALDEPDAEARWRRLRRERQTSGWRYGPKLDGREKTDPRLAEEYDRLDDFWRQRDAVVGAAVAALLPWLR